MFRHGLMTLVLGVMASIWPMEGVQAEGCKGALEPTLPGQCGTATKAGCCDVLGRVWWCGPGGVYCIDCKSDFPSCGWNPAGYYDCGSSEGEADPSGVAPYSCDVCGPECVAGGPCSPQCPGACGTCVDPGATCLPEGLCYVPQCEGRECGVDANGFSCGACESGYECQPDVGACFAIPTACLARQEPGCPGCECEACVCAARPECCVHSWDISCVATCEATCGFSCEACPPEPTCDGLECGTFCGLECGTCGEEAAVCFHHKCCIANCEGKNCGSDGCGGTCGSCQGTDECEGGVCVPCKPQCKGAMCGADGCGGECGVCPDGEGCLEGMCQPATCEGSCGSGSPFGCFCDTECFKYGDCCADICDVCAEICAQGETCLGIPTTGCCDGEVLKRCTATLVEETDCLGSPSCGWNGEAGNYSCGSSGEAEPSGLLPKVCTAWCDQWCQGRQCGTSACGSSCGQCPDGQACTPYGQCCVPACGTNACGDDGCGGSCGECPVGWACESGQCIEACGGLTYQGCCDGETLRYCDGGQPQEQACGSLGPCGWDDNAKYYNCGTTGEADPTGEFPKACNLACIPDCDGLECGSNGCKGSCGECPEGETCASGQCVPGNPEPEPDVVDVHEEDVHEEVVTDVHLPDLNPHDLGEDEGTQPDLEDTAAQDLGPKPQDLVVDTGGKSDVSTQPDSSGKSGSGCSASSRSLPGGHWLLMLAVLFVLRGLRSRRRATGLQAGVLVLAVGVALGGCTGKESHSDDTRSDLGLQDVPVPVDVRPDLGPTDLRPQDGIADLDVFQPDAALPDTHVPDVVWPDGLGDLEAVDAPTDLGDMNPQDSTEVVTPPECDNLPSGPFVLELVPGVVASEDLAFDGDGGLVGSDDTALYKSSADGKVKIFVPNLQFRAGMRYLPSGVLIVADNNLGRLVAVSPEGVVTTVISGLLYPNGLAVDLNGYVYLSEHDAGRVLRVNPGTGEYTVVAANVVNPNGLAFSPDYSRLYVGSFGSGWVYAVSIDSDGTPGRMEEWGDMTDTPGLLDGLGVDVCGNLYVCEYGETKLYRIPPEGGKGELIAAGTDTYIPNLQWGRGPGWDPLSLYLPDGWTKEGVWRLNLGIPSAPLAYP